jgi:anaerobic magnesium-protoporphyrin IX monomethyl ester cyclase
MPTNVLLIYPVPSVSSPQKSPPLSILHVGRALSEAKARGMSDETYNVRYVDERYDPLTPDDYQWADVVGVSSMTGYQLKGAINALRTAKSFNKRTILGGIHVTMQPEQCLSEPYVDAIVTSEGEHAVLDAIDGGPKHVARGHLHSTAEHVSPVSPETLIHFRRSAVTGDTVLMTSRGCPFRCGFCYIQQFFGRSWQPVDMDRWRADVLYLKEHAGVTKYEHGDDWIGKWPRAREIIRFLWDHGIEYRPSIRAHQITDDVAREMADMGIRHISVGMETASERMLKVTAKDITPAHQIECAEALAKHGIWPLYYWITGFPTETPEEINETLDQADRLYAIHGGKLTQNFYAYTALPGSPLFDLVDQELLPKTMAEWSTYSLNQTLDERASNLYHIGGLHFHQGPGDKTDRNFPGALRALIAPYEAEATRRWRERDFTNFDDSKAAIERLLRDASTRYELAATGTAPADVDIMDWGVRESARGEFMTGEIGQ